MSDTPQSRKAAIERIKGEHLTAAHEGIPRLFTYADVGRLLEDRARLESELTQAQSQLKQCAELMAVAADEIENASLYHLSDFQVGCTRCDGVVGDDPAHADDCLVAQLRTAADDADPASTKREG